jgi:tRNA pseudouridine38-40 synthase
MEELMHYYLIDIQYLGFRYHGWLKQPGLKTVELMIEKTLLYVLGTDNFKIMGCSRTDSKVSSNHYLFELFFHKEVDDDFLRVFNRNLPGDIRALKIEEVDKSFSIINTPRTKEYLYLFSYGEKAHPFSAPLMYAYNGNLDIELMKEGAQLFQGKHNFKKYCTKPKPGTYFIRDVIKCEIVENNLYQANFFPKKSFMLKIQSKGFMRYQVRLIMGQLLSLGRREIDLSHIKNSLSPTSEDSIPLRHIAPSSGLILNRIEVDTKKKI